MTTTTIKNLYRGKVSGGITSYNTALPSNANWFGSAYDGSSVSVALVKGTTAAASTTDGGRTWTSRTLPSSSNWSAVAYGASIFAAVSNTSGTVAASSPDGATWTARTLPTTTTWQALAFGNSVFCAVTSSGTAAATSTDGQSWTARTLPVSASWRGIAYGNSTFVAVATASSIAATSADGITWTQRLMPRSDNWDKIAFGNGIFVATGNTSNPMLATSTDGITWTLRGLPVQGTAIVALTYTNSMFVAASSTNKIFTSTDGIIWNYRSSTASSPVPQTVCGGAGGLVIINGSSQTSCILTDYSTTAYTVPASTTTVLTSINVNNDSAATNYINMYINSVQQWANVQIAAGGYIDVSTKLVLNAGDVVKLQAFQPGTLYASLNGVEIA